VNRIRTRLILAFLLATVLPLIATVWIMTSLLERSLSFATTEQLDHLSKSLQETGRHYYQQARENLRVGAESGTLMPNTFAKTDEAGWPADIADFWQSGEPDRFVIAGSGGNARRDGIRAAPDDGELAVAVMQPTGRFVEVLRQLDNRFDLDLLDRFGEFGNVVEDRGCTGGRRRWGHGGHRDLGRDLSRTNGRSQRDHRDHVR